MLSTTTAREHVAGSNGPLLMPEDDEPLVWSQLWIIAERLSAARS
jgi:hypothetical protein